MNDKRLTLLANKVRQDILTMSHRANSAHTGGALSVVEILIVLYFHAMRVFPKNPIHSGRDRLIFSKAHDAKALYAVLARRGFFDEKLLEGYERDGGLLHGHVVRGMVPGVEASAGSLGHGLSIASGMAYRAALDKKIFRVFAILSDGECDEGSTWEAALFAGHHKLDQLIAIVDCNKLQGYGFTKDVLNLEPLDKKWKSFGWEVTVVDGHSISKLQKALSHLPKKKGKPTLIIAHTVKGRGGVPAYVNTVASQYKAPTDEEYAKCIC